MKFLISKNLNSNVTFSLLLKFYTFMIFLYLAGDLFYLVHLFGLDPQSILVTLKGNEEEFIEPLSFISILEFIHVSLFLGILTLFTTMAIILRVNLSLRHAGLIIILSMMSLLISNLSLLALHFTSYIFVYPFYITTLLWHGIGMYALGLISFELMAKKNDR